MGSVLIKNATVVTLGEDSRVLENHDVLIEGNLIKKVASNGKAVISGSKVDKTIDADGMLLMPGFINAHMHFYSSFARGLGKALPSKNFHEVLKNLWWRLDKKLTHEDSRSSALVACVEAIKRGTTTLIDHHASPGAVRGSLLKVADAVREAGLRGSLCYELSDRDGDEIAKEGMEENISFIKSINEKKDDLIRGLFGLHASFTVKEESLKEAVKSIQGIDTGFHIHCAEDEIDQELTRKKTGMRVVERLHHAGVLGSKTICAHCVHVNGKELDLLAESNTIVVHNPQSNMNNAVGVADIKRMMDNGILVGLGTDAMTVNMLEELRSGVWIQKLSQKDPGAGFMECTKALVKNNATIANRYWDGLGEIKEGNKADIILMEYHSPTPLNSENFLGHLVFGLCQGIVDTTIVNGKILMEKRKLLYLDESRIMAKARELSERLWERF